jgi:hypothetical protein
MTKKSIILVASFALLAVAAATTATVVAQEGYRLVELDDYVADHNNGECVQIFTQMGNIRDALMYDIEIVNEDEWADLAEVLTLNTMKTTQSSTGTPQEQYYSTTGLRRGKKTLSD